MRHTLLRKVHLRPSIVKCAKRFPCILLKKDNQNSAGGAELCYGEGDNINA